MINKRDKIQKLKNYFRRYPNSTHRFKQGSKTKLDPDYLKQINSPKKIDLLSGFNTPFANLQRLYVEYARIRRDIPPMFSGLYLSTEQSNKMFYAIDELNSSFVIPMDSLLNEIDTNEFINMFSGFREYSLMEYFKKDLQDYYKSRYVKAPYNILDILSKNCAFLSVKPDIQYISKINSQIDNLRNLVHGLKFLYENESIGHRIIHTGEVFVDFANLIHGIDYIMFGNIYNFHYWIQDEEFVFHFLLDFTKDTISITDRNYYRHSDNVQSPFVAFIRDLQLFRFRMTQYLDIISNVFHENYEDKMVLKELELLNTIQQEDVVHGYFQGDITYKFSAKPDPIQKTNFNILKVNTNNIEILYFYKDTATVQVNKDRIKKSFNEVIDIIDRQGLDSIVYKTINKIVVVNAIDNQNPGFFDTYHGFYDLSIKTLYVYFDETLTDFYVKFENLESEYISNLEYEKLSAFEKREYRTNESYVLLHEIGHHIHNLMSPEANRVWADNVWKFDASTLTDKYLDSDNKHLTKYALTNRYEDFADTFSLALLKLTKPSDKDVVKRLERTLNQSIQDGLDIQPYKDDDLDELIRMVDFNIISKYLGIHTVMLKTMFSFGKKNNKVHSAFLGRLDDFSNFVFHPAVGYYDKTTLPIGYIEVDNPFFLNKINDKFVIIIGYIINVLLLEFTKRKGMDYVTKKLSRNDMPISLILPFQQVIEMASVQIASDIYTWTRSDRSLEPVHRALIKEIISEFVN
jgi:hypothetical protein